MQNLFRRRLCRNSLIPPFSGLIGDFIDEPFRCLKYSYRFNSPSYIYKNLLPVRRHFISCDNNFISIHSLSRYDILRGYFFCQ